jgi:type I restriction enzyme, S subunit
MKPSDSIKVELPLGWSMLPLSECTFDGNISYGVVQPGTHTVNGIPMLRVNNFQDGCLGLQDVLHIAPEIEQKYLRTRLSGGEILLTLVGSTGQSVVAPTNLAGWNVARAIAVIKPRADISANWINLCLQTGAAQHFLDSRANTTVQKTLNLKDIKETPIVFPPEHERRVIEQMAVGLNSKIELNRQMNQTLETMAQAIFQSWFVDFEPVKAKQKAKAAGKSAAEIEMAAIVALSGKSETEIRELSAEVRSNLAEMAGLFSGEFVESELGLIPEGWDVKNLATVTSKIGSGSTPRGGSSVYVDEGVALIRSQNVHDYEFKWDGLVRITDKTADQLKNVTVQSEDILLNITGDSILRTCVVENEVLPARVNQHVAIIRPQKFLASRYLHLYLVQPQTKYSLMGFDTGGTRQAITKGQLESFELIIPSEKLLKKFKELTDSWYEKIATNLAESRTLAELRDSLLPKLLSGELTLPTAQTQATEALVP